jgi:hypothetical protein
MDDSSPAIWPRNVGALLLVAAMVLSGIPVIKVAATSTGTGPFEAITTAPAYTFSDFAWAANGTMGLAVGNTTGNGQVYRYVPRTTVWTQIQTSGIDAYNSVDYLPALNYSEGFESGTPGWTFKNWQGALPWHRVVPTSLPTPSSGRAHSPAHGGMRDLWFGNDTSGDYNDNNKIVRGSAVSPKITLSNTLPSFQLSFWHWWETEASGYDFKYLYIRDTTTTSWTMIGSWSGIQYMPWNQVVIDLSPYRGRTIQLNFTFDSGVDGSANQYCGWHVDDISLSSPQGAFVFVGTTAGGSSAYYTNGYDTPTSMAYVSSFKDVAGGADGKFMAVGSFGAARYYNGTAWVTINGATAFDTLTAVDYNGTHYFVVGYNSIGAGISFYIADRELLAGRTSFHPITGAPAVKLWGVDWSNQATGYSGTGTGAVAATGNVYGLGNPELWKPVSTISVPDARFRHMMCFDDTTDTLVLFGGIVNGIYSSDTWEYSRATGTWNMITPTGLVPPVRHSAGMVFDTALQACVLYGGIYVSGYRTDTWLYYSGNNTWVNATRAVYPPARGQHSMTYDPNYQRVVMFGGFDGVNYRSDTWVWLSSTKTWFNATSGLGPSKRGGAAMTWDTLHSRAILFGGSNGSSNAQTWEFDTGSNTWTLRGTGPITPRAYAGMAYDPVLDKHVLFGGAYAGYLKDTWTYDYNTNMWTAADPHSTPSERYAHTMAYDSDSGRLLMFGGWNTGGYLNDLWQFSLRSPWSGAATGTNGEKFEDVEYGPDGQEALMVGRDTSLGTAVIYKWSAIGTQGGISKKLADPTNALLGHHLYDVEYNPTSTAGGAITVGASAYSVWPHNVQAGTATVDIIYSHVAYLDLYDAGTTTSRLNSQVDVDPGTSTVQYDLVVRAWNVLGQAAITQVNLYMWFDGAGSETEPSPFDTAGFENLRIHMRWTRGAPDTWTRVYPGAGSDLETTLIVPSCTRVDDVDGRNVTLRFRFSPHQQVRCAPGAFVELPGTRFGGGVSEGQSTPLALNALNTWNIRVGVTDSGNNTANAYDEFGFFRYTYVGVAGLPGGGSVYGSGPPSTTITLTPSNQDVTFCSNSIYRMFVTVTDLTGQSLGLIITKNNLTLEGGMLHPAVRFPAIGTPLYLLGEAAVWATPLSSMRTTTTSTGDFNVDLDPVIWRCTIPAVPEDRYFGTATYSVVHP